MISFQFREQILTNICASLDQVCVIGQVNGLSQITMWNNSVGNTPCINQNFLMMKQYNWGDCTDYFKQDFFLFGQNASNLQAPSFPIIVLEVLSSLACFSTITNYYYYYWLTSGFFQIFSIISYYTLKFGLLFLIMFGGTHG